ncbi:MAG: thioredoxin family protein, partial [Ignavibacteriaceae bacterium]|nr:thioredoxin family protein [Ignavibacteriaceae bacterium]
NPILVEVRAEWSGGSHLMDLIINKIEEEFRHQIKVVRIDFEVHKELLSQFGIENAPALLLISKGQIIEVIKETLSRKSLEQIVRNLINRNGSSIREKKSTNS